MPTLGRVIASGSLLMLLVSAQSFAQDMRTRVEMPSAARETMREDMRDHLLALNEILAAMAKGEMSQAGEIAESRLGVSAMGKHRALPRDARPGPHMPEAMHSIGVSGHRAASAFADAAVAGDVEAAMALLPEVMGACVACHYAYRVD